MFGCLVGLELAGCSAIWISVRLAARSVGGYVGWLAAWLVDELHARLVGWIVVLFPSLFVNDVSTVPMVEVLHDEALATLHADNDGPT